MAEVENLVLPMKLVRENYDKVFKALYNAKAHEVEVNRQRISDVTGINVNNVSRAFSFLISIKALEKKGNNVILTKEGGSYAQNIALNFEDSAKVEFNILLRNNEIVKKAIDFLGVNTNIDEENLKKRILGFSKKTIKSDNIAGANILFDMLIYSGIIKSKNDFIVLEREKIQTKNSTETHLVTKKKQIKIKASDVESIQNIGYNIVFNINVNKTMTTSEITEIIKKIKRSISDVIEE